MERLRKFSLEQIENAVNDNSLSELLSLGDSKSQFKSLRKITVAIPIYFNPETESVTINPKTKNQSGFYLPDVTSFEIIRDGETSKKFNLGAAASGAILTGGVGALAGFILPKHQNKITDLRIRVNTTGNKHIHDIIFIDKPTKPKGMIFNGIEKDVDTVADVYKAWHSEYGHTVERSTLSKVESYYKLHILPAIGKRKIQSLKPSKLQILVNDWANEASSGVVWARYLNKLFNYALLHEILVKNPLDPVNIPRAKKVKKQHENFLSSEQLERFLAYWETYGNIKQYAYFRLMTYSGLRRGEIIALKWEDINFKRKQISVNKAVGNDYSGGHQQMYLKTTKTDSSFRNLSIDSRTLEILNQYKQTLVHSDKGDDLWQPSIKNRNRWMDFNIPERWLQSMRRDPNADDDLKQITLHGLRHTHASVLFEQAMQKNKPVPIKAVQKRLGHSSVEMTLDIYTHMSDSENSMVYEFLEEGFN